MQDSDVVSAIVAGDPDGLAEAYDRYAAALYARCRGMLPGPDAADAVQDTFVVATSRLDGLRDPDRLGPWLHAVARNECVRRLGTAAPLPDAQGAEGAEGADSAEGTVPPPGLREQVMAACTDGTPAGRAYRAGVAYRAGTFRGTGFPKPIGTPYWRRPRVALGVALAVLAAAAAAGTIPVLAFGGPHQARAATFALGGGVPAPGSPATPTPTAPPARARSVTGRPSHPAISAGTPGMPAQPSAPGMAPQAGPPVPASARPSPRPPSPAPQPPSQGYLVAAPDQLILVPAAKGKTRGTFVLAATGGPVASFVITVPPELADRIKVFPSSGSLPSGGEVQVTVTVSGKAPLDADLTVNPGGFTVTVLLAPGGDV
jgi:Sigma-70 region 2